MGKVQGLFEGVIHRQTYRQTVRDVRPVQDIGVVVWMVSRGWQCACHVGRKKKTGSTQSHSEHKHTKKQHSSRKRRERERQHGGEESWRVSEEKQTRDEGGVNYLDD